MWRNGNITELLVRIEEQCRLKKQTRSLKRSIKSQGAGRRARMLVQEGALSKAAKTLVGEVATLTGEEQAAWARKLLPNCRAASGGLFVGEDDDGNDGDVDHPCRMKGIHFAVLSAPGISGTRPEHYKEALANAIRTTRTALSKSLDDVINTALRGDLPEIARWILEGRLVYLKKNLFNASAS